MTLWLASRWKRSWSSSNRCATRNDAMKTAHLATLHPCPSVPSVVKTKKNKPRIARMGTDERKTQQVRACA
jgi:hypothetical protein